METETHRWEGDCIHKINAKEQEGWAVRQLFVAPGGAKFVVFEREKKD